jgi:outer membrane protein OmpA-like peptidoglycan-associated protein
VKHDAAPFREPEAGGADSYVRAEPFWPLRDRVEWLLAGGAVAPLVIALLVVLLTANQGSGRGKLSAHRNVPSPASQSVSRSNVVKAGIPAPTVGRPTVGVASVAAKATVAGEPAILPDGSPLPILVIFDGNTITLAGAVPSEAARQRLTALAEAASKTPNAKIVSGLTIDPRISDSAGVRVIEMRSARFESGSSEVSQVHAAELSRVATLMKTLPNLNILVIGHADQRGNSQQNLELSQARASAVVQYLITQGISPDRLSARGVGDRSPLTQQSDAAGLALNRRTEFVFYGLLVGV